MIKFKYYEEKYFYDIEELILNSYKYDFPIWGLSRHEFSKGLHPDFKNCHKVWTESMGLYFESEKLVASVLSEGSYDGDAFFFFDSKERSKDKALLERMVRFSITHLAKVEDNRTTNTLYLTVPDWHIELKDVLTKYGFTLNESKENVNILHFDNLPYEVSLKPEFHFAKDYVKPFYLSNAHRQSFNYGYPTTELGSTAFENLRTMKHYDSELEVVILDSEERPVGFAIGWANEKMPYAELEPMAVVWWCRRQGLATALIHELSNRVRRKYPNIYGITGGDQPFYYALGFKNVASLPVYVFKKDIYISWDSRSLHEDYSF